MPYIGNQPYQGVIDSGNILNGSIDTVDLKDGSVTGAKLETLAGLTANTYGSSSAVPQITVDAKGRITSVSSVNISSLGDTVINSTGTSAALRITQTGTGNALLVEDSANPDATPFVVDASGVVGIGTTTNTNSSALVVNGTISQTVSGTQYLVVDQSDIGTAPNEIPLNQYLGSLAYQDASSISVVTWQAVQTAAFTAIAGMAYPCNTTSAAFTVTLPSSPAAGNVITLLDYAGTWGTNNLTVNPNGLKINGATANATLSTNRGSVQLVYVDSTQGWVAYSGFALSSFGIPLEYLVVAGGGGGGNSHGGGGGGGGLLTNIGGTTINGSVGNSLTITVGAGGNGGSGSEGAAGSNGATSSISGTGITTVTALGGGGGGGRLTTGLCSQAGAASSGTVGSGGGGGGGGTTLTGVGTSGQGKNGGAGSSNAQPTGAGNGGGGGGAGFAGGAATGTSQGAGSSGAGGDGVQNAITGTTTYYAGGGSGGRWQAGTVGAAGQGGGGTGGNNDFAAGSAGTNGLGGGGGGGGGGAANGGRGGDGVVIIRYPDTYAAATSTTGSPTITTTGGYRIYKWTGNGSITF